MGRVIVVWFCRSSCLEGPQSKMVFLCFRASITVGCLSVLIGPDGPSLCLSDLSTVTILSSAYISSWPTSQQDRWRDWLEFQKRAIYREKNPWQIVTEGLYSQNVPTAYEEHFLVQFIIKRSIDVYFNTALAQTPMKQQMGTMCVC